MDRFIVSDSAAQPVPPRVVITGGSGFIGTNTIQAFSAGGWSVLNIDIARPPCAQHLGFWRRVDILDRESLKAAVVDWRPEVVIHLAARTDLDERRHVSGYAANIEGVANMIEAIEVAGSVSRTVFASSRLVFDLGHVPAHDRDYHASTLYGQSKARGEELIHAAGTRLNTWTIVRPTGIWGPWFGAPYRDFFGKIRRGLYVHPGSLHVRKSFGYVENTVRQIQRLVDADPSAVHRQTFWLADPPIVIREWAEEIRRAFEARPIRSVPVPVLRVAGAVGDLLQNAGIGHAPLTGFRVRNMTTDMLYDVGPLAELTGPLPFTSQDGVDRTVTWLLGQERRQ